MNLVSFLSDSLTTLNLCLLPAIDKNGLRRSHTQQSNHYMWLNVVSNSISFVENIFTNDFNAADLNFCELKKHAVNQGAASLKIT